MTQSSQSKESPCVGSVLQVTAPLDTGLDAPVIARRLLLSVDRCGDLRIQYEPSEAKSVSRQVPRRQANSVESVQLLNGDTLVEIDTTRVIAVSYCTSPTHSGVCLFGAAGPVLTMSSSNRCGVDEWIGAAIDIFDPLP